MGAPPCFLLVSASGPRTLGHRGIPGGGVGRGKGEKPEDGRDGGPPGTGRAVTTETGWRGWEGKVPGKQVWRWTLSRHCFSLEAASEPGVGAGPTEGSLKGREQERASSELGSPDLLQQASERAFGSHMLSVWIPSTFSQKECFWREIGTQDSLNRLPQKTWFANYLGGGCTLTICLFIIFILAIPAGIWNLSSPDQGLNL